MLIVIRPDTNATRGRRIGIRGLGILSLLLAGAALQAQQPVLDRLASLPGFDRFTAMQAELRKGPAFASGALSVVWAEDGRSVSYALGGRAYRYDLASKTAADIGDASAMPRATERTSVPRGANPCPVTVVERGRQSGCAASPDLTRRAIYRDRNVFVSEAEGGAERAITTDGDARTRIKYGVASWVYGEELDQTTAMWWSPDGSKLAFYRFDERHVRDYYLQIDQTALQSAIDVEAYPKAGTSNPIADVLVHDFATGQTRTLDVRDGRPFSDEGVGHYVYAVQWSPDSREIRLYRSNRRQQVLEFIGCQPSTGACRVILRESTTRGWLEHRPAYRPLSDGRRFIWGSDRNGWRNYYLYDVDGTLINAVTANTGFDADGIVHVDEAAGQLFYMARDGRNPLQRQLHRVSLDGGSDVRLTDPGYTHTVSVSPDAAHIVDVYQRHDTPPATRLISGQDGAVMAELATSDLSRFRQLGLRVPEQFTYLAADGRTTLYGSVMFPSTYRPGSRHPVLVQVYGGPDASAASPSEVFTAPSPLTEYGFLVVLLSSRAMSGLGRDALDSLYLKLGQTEVDDLAEGLRAVAARPDVDPTRIGVFGTSYGGYVAGMLILRYPELVAAASASSPVTDWRHYDTIYTERYMWTPQGNPDGYDAGSLIQLADRLRGRLLLYYGTADNNVHPSNALQFIDALNRAAKSYEVQVGPDAPHSAVSQGRMMEFFIEHLVMHPERLRTRP